MMKKSLLLFSSILLFSYAIAQEKSTKMPCIRVSSFSSSLGFAGALTSNTNEDYYLLKKSFY